MCRVQSQTKKYNPSFGARSIIAKLRAMSIFASLNYAGLLAPLEKSTGEAPPRPSSSRAFSEAIQKRDGTINFSGLFDHPLGVASSLPEVASREDGFWRSQNPSLPSSRAFSEAIQSDIVVFANNQNFLGQKPKHAP